MKLDTGGTAGPTNYALRNDALLSPTYGDRTIITTRIYCDTIGTLADSDYLQITFDNETTQLRIKLCSDGMFIYDGVTDNEVGTNIVVQDTWQTWTFDVNWVAQTVDVYLDVSQVRTLQGSANVDFSYAVASYNGYKSFWQKGNTTVSQISYVDFIAIGTGSNGVHCISADFSNYDMTLTHPAGITLTISDSLKFVTGMTYTVVSQITSIIDFLGTGTNNDLTFAGQIPGRLTFATGTYDFNDPLVGSSTYMPQIRSTSSGVTATLTCNVRSNVYFEYVDIQDITFAGTAKWFGGAKSTYRSNISNVIQSAGWKDYSRADVAAIPSTDAELSTLITIGDYTEVSSVNAVYDIQSSVGQYSIFLLKDRSHSVSLPIIVTWTGKSDRATTSSTVYLQIYDRVTGGGTWTELSHDDSHAAGEDFSLLGNISTNLANYYDAEGWVACRVYQRAI
jgi:hypothetical protein